MQHVVFDVLFETMDILWNRKWAAYSDMDIFQGLVGSTRAGVWPYLGAQSGYGVHDPRMVSPVRWRSRGVRCPQRF